MGAKKKLVVVRRGIRDPARGSAFLDPLLSEFSERRCRARTGRQAESFEVPALGESRDVVEAPGRQFKFNFSQEFLRRATVFARVGQADVLTASLAAELEADEQPTVIAFKPRHANFPATLSLRMLASGSALCGPSGPHDKRPRHDQFAPN